MLWYLLFERLHTNYICCNNLNKWTCGNIFLGNEFNFAGLSKRKSEINWTSINITYLYLNIIITYTYLIVNVYKSKMNILHFLQLKLITKRYYICTFRFQYIGTTNARPSHAKMINEYQSLKGRHVLF